MSVLLEYHSVQPVSEQVASAIETEQSSILKSRCYWAEPLRVELENGSPSKLSGDNAMFNSGGYETQSGEWMEVSQDEDFLMAWNDTNFIVNQLSIWSKRYGIDWHVYSSGEPIGNISNGLPDKKMLDFVQGIKNASELNAADLEAIDKKFSNRCEPPSTSQNPQSVSQPLAVIKRKSWWQLWL